jgi:AcrR family transcriptional regulator
MAIFGHMTKKERQKRRPDPNTRVLTSAARLFRVKGFGGAGLRQIAAGAGMLLGSVQYRYPTKESILIALMQQAMDQSIAVVREAVADCEDPVERIRLALRAHLRMLISGGDSIYVLLYEWRALSGKARAQMIALRDQYESFWAGMLTEAAGTGMLRDRVDLRLVRLFGFGAINWASQWYRAGGGLTPEEIADAFFAFMAFGVLADRKRPAKLRTVLQSLHAVHPDRSGN